MKSETSLDGLVRDLVWRGIPVDYAHSTVAELKDHRDDILRDCEDRSAELADARLGSTEVLADRIASSYRQRTFSGRHPWWTFLVAPLPTMVLSWTALFVVLYLISFPLNWLFGDWANAPGPNSAWVIPLACGFTFFVVNFAPAVSACVFARLAVHSGRGVRWLIASCVPIAVIAWLLSWRVEPLEGSHGRTVVGFMLADAATMLEFLTRPIQLSQLMLPITLAAAIYSWHHIRLHQKLQTA